MISSIREQVRQEHVIARAVNKKIEEAAWLAHDMLKDQLEDEEDQMHPVVEAILALVLPFHREEIEAIYTRRDVLIHKQYYPKWLKLTSEEQEEYDNLQRVIETLPSARDVQDQKMWDDMRWLSDRLRHPKGKSLFEDDEEKEGEENG